MSERRRSAAALSSRAHAFSVEALIGSNKKRKLRGWEEKELELSMESLAADGEDPAHCLDMDPGQCADTHHTAQMFGSPLRHCTSTHTDEPKHGSVTRPVAGHVDPEPRGGLFRAERFCSVSWAILI